MVQASVLTSRSTSHVPPEASVSLTEWLDKLATRIIAEEKITKAEALTLRKYITPVRSGE